MTNYFEELLDSYNKLKKRQLRICLSKINEQATTEAEAESLLKAALDSAKNLQYMPGKESHYYHPFGKSKNFKFYVTRSGGNEGGINLIWPGLPGWGNGAILNSGGQIVCSDEIWAKLIKAFMSGGPDTGEIVDPSGSDEAETKNEILGDPERILRNRLDGIHTGINVALDAARKTVSKLMDKGFLPVMPDSKPWVKNWKLRETDPKHESEKYLNQHFFSGRTGSLPTQILNMFEEGKDAVFAHPEDNKGELLTRQLEAEDIVDALERQNEYLNVMLRFSEKGEMTSEDSDFCKQHIRKDPTKGKYSVYYRGDLDNLFGISFDFGESAPVRLFTDELINKLKGTDFADSIVEQSLVPNASQSVGALNSVMGQSSEKLFIALSMLIAGKTEIFHKLVNEVIELGEESLLAAWKIKSLVMAGDLPATEGTEELSNFLETLGIEEDTIPESLRGIIGRVFDMTKQFLAPGAKGREFMIQVGGKVGPGLKADTREGGRNKDNVIAGLVIAGYTETRAAELVETTTIRQLLEDDILTKGESTKERLAPSLESHLKSFRTDNSLDATEFTLDTEIYTHRIGLKLYQKHGQRNLGRSVTLGSVLERLGDTEDPFTQKIRSKLGIDDDPDVSAKYEKSREEISKKLATIDTLFSPEKVNVTVLGMDSQESLDNLLSIVKNAGISDFGNTPGEREDINELLEKIKEKEDGKGGANREINMLKAFISRKVTWHHLTKNLMSDKKGVAKAARAGLASIKYAIAGSYAPLTIVDGTITTGALHIVDSDEYLTTVLREFVDGKRGFTYNPETTSITITKDGTLGIARKGNNSGFYSKDDDRNMRAVAGKAQEETSVPNSSNEATLGECNTKFIKDFLNNQQQILEKLFNTI